MTFVALLLNVIVPLLVAGVGGYLCTLPDAPLSDRAKRVVPWVLWAIAVLWAVVWALSTLGAFDWRPARTR